MGGVSCSTCCTTDASQPDLDARKLPAPKQEKKKLLSEKPILSNHQNSLSVFVTPNVAVKAEPLLADQIFPHPTYLALRQELEGFVESRKDIEEIRFEKNKWIIFSKKPKILDECRSLFDIIAWRLPVIDAFGKGTYFDDKEDYIKRLLKITDETPNLTFTYDEIMRGIWDIMSQDEFIKRFNNDLYDKLDLISKDKHYYLTNHQKQATTGGGLLAQSHRRLRTSGSTSLSTHNVPIGRTMSFAMSMHRPQVSAATHSSIASISSLGPNGLPLRDDLSNVDGEDKQLIIKLNKIKTAQRAHIVIIGQKKIVRYLIRKIRENEVNHPSMFTFIKRASQDIVPLPSLNMIDISVSTLTLHTIEIANIPPNTLEEDLMDFLKQFGKILDISLKIDFNSTSPTNSTIVASSRLSLNPNQESNASIASIASTTSNATVITHDINSSVSHVSGMSGISGISGMSGISNINIGPAPGMITAAQMFPRAKSSGYPPMTVGTQGTSSLNTYMGVAPQQAQARTSMNKLSPLNTGDGFVSGDGIDGISSNSFVSNASAESGFTAMTRDIQFGMPLGNINSGNSGTTSPNGNIVGPTMVATLAFETKEALDKIYNATESENGLEFRGYLLVVTQNSMKTIVKLKKFM